MAIRLRKGGCTGKPPVLYLKSTAVEHQGEQDEEHTRAGNGRCSRRKSRTTRLRSRTKTTGTRGGRASRGRLAWDGIALQRPMRGYGVGHKRGKRGTICLAVSVALGAAQDQVGLAVFVRDEARETELPTR